MILLRRVGSKQNIEVTAGSGMTSWRSGGEVIAHQRATAQSRVHTGRAAVGSMPDVGPTTTIHGFPPSNLLDKHSM